MKLTQEKKISTLPLCCEDTVLCLQLRDEKGLENELKRGTVVRKRKMMMTRIRRDKQYLGLD